MQRLEVSGAVWPIYGSLDVKRLMYIVRIGKTIWERLSIIFSLFISPCEVSSLDLWRTADIKRLAMFNVFFVRTRDNTGVTKALFAMQISHDFSVHPLMLIRTRLFHNYVLPCADFYNHQMFNGTVHSSCIEFITNT